MATLARRPLAARSSLPHLTAAVLSTKRPRSPEPPTEARSVSKSAKRVRSLGQASVTVTLDETKGKKKAEREQQKTEFREKYTKAFPSWIFYFDPNMTDGATTELAKEDLERKIRLLGGRVEDFFSKDVTHLITDWSAAAAPSSNKENIGKAKAASLKSPIKLRGRHVDDAGIDPEYNLVSKAQSFGQKIWTTMKLVSVVDRCLSIPIEKPSASTGASALPPQSSLSRLLQSERLNGTCERDPAERRHDYRYFSKDSYFVLVEDIRQECATIAAQEYLIPKPNSSCKPSWPILHCHPHSRGPFIEFDDKEKKRWEKMQQAERTKHSATHATRAKKVKATLKLSAAGDLRRSVSMNSLRRQVSHPDDVFRETNLVDLDADDEELNGSNYASGYILSGAYGHTAASGNSVGLTSTTGTTSTTGSTRLALHLPAPLRGRLQHHVVTSRKFPMGERNMGPPDAVPRTTLLRKSRSTNTIRLPKRDEGMKPGYCESCRCKFDDFRKHVQASRHRKFAVNDDNFLQLDYVLTRVKRRTVEEVRNAQVDRERRHTETQTLPSVSGNSTHIASYDDL